MADRDVNGGLPIDPLDAVAAGTNPTECPQCGGDLVVAEPAEPGVGIMTARMACDTCVMYLDEMEG